MESDEDNSPQQQHEDGETDTGGKRNAPVSPTRCFPYQTQLGRRKDLKFFASCMKFNANWKN